jgi:hypothetical protein
MLIQYPVIPCTAKYLSCVEVWRREIEKREQCLMLNVEWEEGPWDGDGRWEMGDRSSEMGKSE